MMEKLSGFFVLICVGTLYAEKLTFKCPLPKEPLYGSFDKEGDYLIYSCDEGFMRFGSRLNYRRCRPNGKWTGKDMDCVRSFAESRMCPMPKAPSNGFVRVTSRHVGGKAIYSCDSGYNMKGSSFSTCLPSYTWGGVFPSCNSFQSIKDITNHLKESFIDKMEEASVDSKSGLQGKLSAGKSGLDIVFILDTSSSMGSTVLEQSKTFTNTIIDIFGVSKHADGGKNGTRVALLTFNDQANVVFNLDDPKVRSKKKAIEMVNSVKAEEGGTDFSEALTMVSVSVKPKLSKDLTRTRALFFITDSENKADKRTKAKTMRRAMILRNDEHFEVFAIGVGKNVDTFALADIASTPHIMHVFILSDFQQLKEMTDIIAETNIDYGQCGISGRTEIHPSSDDANLNAWPWLSWISVMDTEHVHTCGAALLCRRWIVTAAHCVTAIDKSGLLRVFNGKDITVHLGDHALYKRDDSQVMSSVERVLVHPQYNGQINEHGVRNYDIALLRLHGKTKPPFAKAIRPLCFPTKLPQTGRGKVNLYTAARVDLDQRLSSQQAVSPGGFTAGWGHRPGLGYGKPTGHLKQRTREIQPQSRCLKKYPGLDTSMFFCVYNTFGETGRCEGDIGGPYMNLLSNKRYVMLGVALNTSECTRKDEFSLFLNVLHPGVVEWVGGKLKKCNRFQKLVRKSESHEKDAAEDGAGNDEEENGDNDDGEKEEIGEEVGKKGEEKIEKGELNEKRNMGKNEKKRKRKRKGKNGS